MTKLKPEEGWIDKKGITWYSEGYVDSTKIIAKAEERQRIKTLIEDEIKICGCITEFAFFSYLKSRDTFLMCKNCKKLNELLSKIDDKEVNRK